MIDQQLASNYTPRSPTRLIDDHDNVCVVSSTDLDYVVDLQGLARPLRRQRRSRTAEGGPIRPHRQRLDH